MILENAKPRLVEAYDKAQKTGVPQEVKFIYNEILNYEEISPVFKWLFKEGMDFTTRRDEYRYVLIMNPKAKEKEFDRFTGKALN